MFLRKQGKENVIKIIHGIFSIYSSSSYYAEQAEKQEEEERLRW